MNLYKTVLVATVLIVFLVGCEDYTIKNAKIKTPIADFEVEEREENLPVYPPSDITIEKFDSILTKYYVGENATVEFSVNNRLGVPYTSFIDWRFSNVSKFKWSQEGCSNYSMQKSQAWYLVTEKGMWEVFLVVKYKEGNFSKAKERTISFEVT